MNDRAAFATLVDALSPWNGQLVFVGGWAHRLYRLHPRAGTLDYQPLVTLDADIAFGYREQLEGNIQARLHEFGFREELSGSHKPPARSSRCGCWRFQR